MESDLQERFLEWARDTRMPSPPPPPLSCDSQFHIFEDVRKYPAKPGALYEPPRATFDDMRGVIPDQEGEKIETSPHAAALELVFKTQAARIRAVDTENWWHDVKERTWSVRRPFSPGYIDSTYMFEVSYRIDGNEAAAWLVDTRKKTVELRQPKAK